jgi:hypothetical protein
MLGKCVASVALALGLALAGCADDGGSSDGSDALPEASTDESNLTTAEATRVCNAIAAPRPWTQAESEQLLAETVRRFAELKRNNDALVAQRGVGGFAGAKSSVWKAISTGDRARAATIIRPHLKPGFDANQVAGTIDGTSCIGVVYRVLGAVYASLGRAEEWKAIEKCGRAFNSDGLHVQQALMKNGWPAPTLGFVTDANKLPGSNDEDVGQHRAFVNSAAAGVYFGTPVSKTMMLKNFLPSPGSNTRLDEELFLRIGRSRTIAMSTMRGAFHVPFIVPASFVPQDLAPRSAGRTEWLNARERGEPFVLESHSLREPWDDTNFEVRSLKATIKETVGKDVTYGTGTLLFAPLSESPLASQQ